MVVGREPVISGTRMVGTNKSLGQHWLKNREILDEIADLARGDVEQKIRTCLEIGPGLGTLTAPLLKRFNKVIAVEYDERLAKNLPKSFPGTNLEVVNDDILEYKWWDHMSGRYVVAGNIPYYITSPIIGRILESDFRPVRAVLLMQKEVAERVAGKKCSSPLSLLAEAKAEVKLGRVVKAEEFEPAPEVDSQIVVFEMRKKPLADTFKMTPLYYLAFEHPRKKLLNNLMAVGTRDEVVKLLNDAEIPLNARPGNLSLDDYIRLSDAMDREAEEGYRNGKYPYLSRF